MKRPTTLHGQVLDDFSICTNVAVKRDVQNIERRCEKEGMSFLTITLPSLCDALDQGLALGRLSPSMFNGFKPFKRGGMLPGLLSGFFRRIFHEDGSLLECPCIDSIRAVRQVTRLFKKVELPCSPARRKAAFERYKSNDESVPSNASHDGLLGLVASYLWSDLEFLSERFYCSPGIFGSGATAEKYGFNKRHTICEWPERGSALFPLSYHCSHREDDQGAFAGVEILDRGNERPVRVVQVPKTLKTPRTISVEPSYMMLRQQSIAKVLMDYLEGPDFPYQSIRFTDQSVNRRLAREGSIDGSLATIDLSDASDLVSNDLVKYIFKSCPTFLDYVQGCRSEKALMPDNSLVYLRKFASMGSALCFPIEAMVFFTIVISAMVSTSGSRPSRTLIRKLAAKTAIYGDDIIIPSATAGSVIERLEAHGLRVNFDKSFTTGFFRESCGGDYFMGFDITPVYCRQLDNGTNTCEPEILAASISLSNQFYTKGNWHVSQKIRDSIELRLRRRLPRSRRPIGGLSWASYLYDTNLRWDAERCAWRTKSLKLSARRIDDHFGMLHGAMLLAFGSKYLSSYRHYLRRVPEFAYQERINALRQARSAADISFHVPSDSTCGSEQREVRLPGILDLDVGSGGTWALDDEWESYLRNNGGSGKPQSYHGPDGLITSIKPHALNMKRGWIPVNTGIWG